MLNDTSEKCTQVYFECNGESLEEYITRSHVPKTMKEVNCQCGDNKEHRVEEKIFTRGEAQTFFVATIGARNDNNQRADRDTVANTNFLHTHKLY